MARLASVPWDAAVVGGGPAGSCCARSLARAGLRVVVIERERLPRYKACGGGLVGRALRLLDLDLETLVEDCCRVAEIHLHDAALSVRVERTEPVITMAMRSDLDSRLLAEARREGAEVLQGCAATGLLRTPGGLLLRTARGDLRTRYLVIADGAGGSLARAAGWPPNPHLAPAIESEILPAREDLERFRGCARFDFGIVAAGYCWVFPKRHHLSIGCLSVRPGAAGLRRDLERYLDRLGLTEITEREDHGFVIPLAPRRGRLAAGRVLLVGDAAGLADPLTCEGISWALESGGLAAEAIASAFPEPTDVVRLYRNRLRRQILAEQRLGRALARLLYGAPALRRAAFRRLGAPLARTLCDVFDGRQTYRGLLGRPAGYLRLGRRLLGHRRRPG